MQPAKHTFTRCLVNGREVLVNKNKLPDDLPPVEMCNRAAFVRRELNKRGNIPAIENFFINQNKKA